ncbi:MAG: SCP2 sterol-binding domain-containing protein [Actinomycetota bacterium]
MGVRIPPGAQSEHPRKDHPARRPRLSATSDFLETLPSRNNDPVLRQLSGTIRLDLRDGKVIESWFLQLDDGEVKVSHRKGKADCIATMEAKLSDGLATGKLNAVSAALRGEIEIQGQVALLLGFQRLYPGPPRDRAGA